MAERGSIFDDVKRQVDLVEYLSEHAGAEFVSDGGDRLAACCPFHEEDTPSFKVQDARSGEPWKVWHCFGACDDGGTIIDAVMRHQGFETAFEAIDYLNELYGLELQHDTERYQAFKKTTAEAKEKIDRTQAEMASESKAAQAAKAFLHRRGFTDDTIAHFELAVDTSRSKAGRLAIPIYDRSNHPITISNRALFDSYKCASCGETVKAKEVVARRHQAQKAAERGGEPVDWEACPHCGAGKAEARISWLTSQHPKYLNERDYEKSKILYNEPTARKFLREDECLGYFIAEGYADVWATYQGGQKAASSYNGSTISDWQAEEAAELCASQDPPKPIVLIPDFDATGLSKISKNIATIRKVKPDAEIQVIHSLEVEGRPHKDMGEVLEEEGAEWVATICQDRRISADEWLIREVMDAINPKTGQPFHSKERQMELISEILRDVHYVAGLDHMAPYLSEKWGVGEDRVRDFLYTQISDSAALPAQHLMKTVNQARMEAIEYLKDDFSIPFGFDAIDRCLPMNGAKTRQLAMFIGKSGTGKAQPLDAKVLTPTGWITMGDVAIGETLVDPTGDTTTVVGIFPQGERDIWAVDFDGGQRVECDLEHLWTVYIEGEWGTYTLSDLIPLLHDVEVYVPAFVEDEAARGELVIGPQMRSAAFVRRAEAQCIKVDSDSELYVTDGNIVTHNTLITTQILANMARRGVRSIFFSLEQPAAQLYMRMVAQTLDVRMDEGIELIKENSPRLDELDELFENLIIVDNVPEDASAMVEMTPDRILKVIQEINLTKLAKPAQVVAIDHLGILQVPSTAPRSVQNDDMQAAGYIMQELFKVTKIADVLTLVLQQLPKEVRSGVEIAADQGRGGSKQTDYCDYIFTLWRPEQQEGLTDEDRIALEGRYMLALKKNRHGASTIANLYFDRKNLRITPALDIMPTNFGGGIDQTADGAPVVIGAEGEGGAIATSPEASVVEEAAVAADPSDEELMRELVDDVAVQDPGLPVDNAQFLELLGAGGDDADGDDPFGGMGSDYFEN